MAGQNKFRQRLDRLDDLTIYRRGRPTAATWSKRAYLRGFLLGYLPPVLLFLVLTITFDLMGALWIVFNLFSIALGSLVGQLNVRRYQKRDT